MKTRKHRNNHFNGLCSIDYVSSIAVDIPPEMSSFYGVLVDWRYTS
ncbi:MAG: hypothetical protein KAT41_07080 [Candidatus Marinimicrobia bacterium]|nr:hypothetical protein [Candidatus Neomarinimicrobiota bacterium]